MGTPEPTLTDVLHAVTLVAEQVESLRVISTHNFAAIEQRFLALERRIDTIDRDLQGLARFVAGQGEE